MRVLFVGARDWANLAHRLARALRAAGAEARVYVRHPHPFGYDEDLVGDAGLEEASAFGASCDWSISTGDGDYRALGELDALFGARARRATMHVGSAYRARWQEYNRRDHQLGFEARFVSADSLRFCLDDRRAHPIPCVADAGLPQAALDGPVRVSHSPSSRRTKGTGTVIDALGDLGLDVIENVSHAECLARRAQSRIFVGQLSPGIGGFGQSSVEALSQGCATLCDVRHVHPKVWESYARPPLLDVRSGAQLRAEVLRLQNSPAQLLGLQRLAVEWAHTTAAPGNVGRYLLDALEAA